MNGFAVIWRLDGSPVSLDDMGRMLSRLGHRGEERRQKLVTESTAFGAAQGVGSPEAILENRLPGQSAADIILVGDVRLDNREELIERLKAHGEPHPKSDAELACLCYKALGEESFGDMIGDFAFAVWDSRKRRLVCARDSMGVKHFCYYHKPGKLFALASEAKALFELSEIPREIDERAVGDYLIFNYHDKESTMFKGVRRLPANCRMTVSIDKVDIHGNWQPKPTVSLGLRSAGDFEAAFREILVESIRCRSEGAGAVGTMLSGGLDSSTITCVASAQLSGSGRPPIKSYSAIFPDIAAQDARIDERRFIKSVIEHSGCDPVSVIADGSSPFTHMKRLHEHADHPVGAPNVFMDLAILEAAHTNGTNVLLSGFDGDSAVSYGYEGFEEMAKKWQVLRLFRSARKLERNMPSRHHEFQKLVWNRGLRNAVPGRVRSVWRFLNGIERVQIEERRLPSQTRFCYESLREDFAKNHDLEERFFALLDKNHPERESTELEFWEAICSGIFAFALETFEKAAASFGIEQRYPFFDRRLIEFCSRIPGWQRVYGGWTRSILRRSTRGILPEDVRWRTDKANIGISFKLNLHRFGNEIVKEAIFGRPEVLEPFVDIDVLRGAYRRFDADPLKYEGEPIFINSCVNLSHWLRMIDGDRAPDTGPLPVTESV